MLAAENWCVKVDSKIYGPYTSQQMRKFAHEGRVAGVSLIAPAGSRAWREAREEAAFSSFFGNTGARVRGGKNGRVFGKADTGEQKDSNSTNGPNTTQADNVVGIANFVVIFDVVSGAASRVEAAVVSLGHSFQIADNVWSITCELTAVGVRNAIAPYLNPRESLFVVDASRGRTSWQNYAPETQAKLTASYTAAVARRKRQTH